MVRFCFHAKLIKRTVGNYHLITMGLLFYSSLQKIQCLQTGNAE